MRKSHWRRGEIFGEETTALTGAGAESAERPAVGFRLGFNAGISTSHSGQCHADCAEGCPTQRRENQGVIEIPTNALKNRICCPWRR